MSIPIPMVDLKDQYNNIQEEIDTAIQEVIQQAAFINGPQVRTFCSNLATYLNIEHVVPCGNGTDALRLALLSLNIAAGDEVIMPAFTYIAAAEMIAALGALPVLVDVDAETFNLDPEQIERAITRQTKAIIVVHLFGQTANMEQIMQLAEQFKIKVIEDNAQSIGADYTFSNGTQKKAGTIGDIGITSFFPTKPLGCYGDGGAIMTADKELAEKMYRLANHGQTAKYHHAMIGCNSRLDTIQAAILNVKLKYIDPFAKNRRSIAQRYDQALRGVKELVIPHKTSYSTHVYHQYTIQVKGGMRDALRAHLNNLSIAAAVYYPLAVQEQEGYKWITRISGNLTVATELSREVLSLPIYAEMPDETTDRVIDAIVSFFNSSCG